MSDQARAASFKNQAVMLTFSARMLQGVSHLHLEKSNFPLYPLRWPTQSDWCFEFGHTNCETPSRRQSRVAFRKTAML
jgi:hypothetical protein